MSKPRPLTTPLLRRLLPALRMLARFPTRPVQDVSFMTEVELSDLQAFIASEGQPTEDSVKLLEYHLDKSDTDGVAPPWAPPAEPVVAPVKLPIAAGTDAAANAKEYKWREGAQKSKAARDAVWMPKYRAIAAELCANPWLKENTACKAQGVAAGTWCGFKLRTLGQSQGLDREALRKYFNLPPSPVGEYQANASGPMPSIAAAAADAVQKSMADFEKHRGASWFRDRPTEMAPNRDKTPEESASISKPIKENSARNEIARAEQAPASQKLSLTAPGFSQPFTIRITLELIPAGGEA
jgi:hypothetical protein